MAQLTVKQQRDARRAEKVEALKKQLATQKRNRRIGIIAGVTAGVVVVGLIITFVITGSTPRQNPDDIAIEGLRDFGTLTAVHVGPEPVDYKADYDMDPPAGGDHFAAWLNCGVYDQPQANENAVHSLEHGAVWVTYDPDLPESEVAALREAVPSTYSILSPYPGLSAPVVVSAWGAQVELDGADDPRLQQFVQKYWKASTAPEPGAPCTGAVDGPGRVS